MCFFIVLFYAENPLQLLKYSSTQELQDLPTVDASMVHAQLRLSLTVIFFINYLYLLYSFAF